MKAPHLAAISLVLLLALIAGAISLPPSLDTKTIYT